ncbi:MAG: MFS transporter [Promethearchaeia archaeon]
MPQKPDQNRFTDDFKSMIKIISWNTLGFFFIGFLIPIVARAEMGATATQIGLVVSIQTIGFTSSSLLTGFLTDRVKKKKTLILIGSIGRGLAYFLIFWAFLVNSIIFLTFGTFSLGFLAGFYWIPFDALISEKSNKRNRSQAFGKRDAANVKGQIVGALLGFGLFLLGNEFLDLLLIRYLAIPLFGIGNFIGGILFYRNVDESIIYEEINVNSRQDMNDPIEETEFSYSRAAFIGLLFLLIVIFVSNVNGQISRPFLNVYIWENLEQDISLVILIYLPGGLLSSLLAPKLGELLDKLSPRIGITITSTVGAVTTWFLINTQNVWVFAILLFIDILVVLGANLVFQNFLSRITLKHRGKIFGVHQVFTNMGKVVGPVVGGILWDAYGPKSPFLVSIIIELCLIPLYWIVVHYLRPYIAESYEK